MGIGLVVAALVGAGIALQVAILGRSSMEANPLATSFALQLAGAVSATIWATARDEWRTVFELTFRWWWLPLGIGGWVLVAALGFASGRIGVATTLAVSIGMQLTIGLVIESALSGRPVDVASITGAALIATGAVIIAVP